MQFRTSKEAMQIFSRWENQLDELQKDQLLHATISQDKDEWCILSGPDLTLDRAGFGATLEDAIEDYVSIYVKA